MIDIGVGSRELRNIFNLSRLFIVSVSTIVGFYTFPYILPFLNLPNFLWVKLAASGIFGYVLAEVIF